MFMAIVGCGHGQYHKEMISKELAFETSGPNNVLLVANINGPISVEGYNGDKVLLEAELLIKAKTDARLQKAKDQIEVDILDRYDSIIVYIKGPCGGEGRVRSYDGKKAKWKYYWNDCNFKYDFKVSFKLRVPRALNVYLSTVNDGNITVANVSGSLDLHNVNGDIAVNGAEGYTYAHSINGDISLKYNKVPDPNSSFYTLNGDIDAYFPSNLRADITFKSFNGDIYTDYENIEHKPMVLAKNERVKRQGTSFKVEARSVISFGGGGPQLDFETFNGDVYIRQL